MTDAQIKPDPKEIVEHLIVLARTPLPGDDPDAEVDWAGMRTELKARIGELIDVLGDDNDPAWKALRRELARDPE